MAKKQKVKNRKRVRRIITPSHTRGYYRFSKDFPSVTDSEGYRDNELIVNSPAKKASVRRGLIILFVCVFAVTFFSFSVGFSLSKMPVSEKEESFSDTQVKLSINGTKAVCLSGEVLSADSVESIIGSLRICGVNTVVIDFKDAAGNFYYKPSSNVPTDALYMASEKSDAVIKAFKDASISVIARFACFADDIYARNHQDEAAYVMIEPDSGSNEKIRTIWYNNGNDSHAWINPHSAEVQYYLHTAVTDIIELNVDGIIFDYVTMPASAVAENVKFAGQIAEGADEAMASFISVLNNTYKEQNMYSVVPSDVMLSALQKGSAPEIFGSGCDYIVPDMRLSLIPDNSIVGSRQYVKAALSPAEFITDYINAVTKLIKDSEIEIKMIPLLETSDTNGKQLNSVAVSDVDSYIMFNESDDYKSENFVIS